VRSLLARRFAELGITPRPGESDQRRELRAVVVAALGSLGNDAEVIAQARTATEQALAGGTPLDATAADAIVSVAASRGDASLWEALAAAAQRASSPEEQYRYLYALGDFEDAALVQRGLEYSLTDAVRAQNAGRYLARFLSNPDINARAWAFVKEHWTDLEPKISVAFSDVRIVQALGSFCDATAGDDIRSFFATHRLGSASRTVDQTLERIDNCVAIRAPQTESVTGWLMSR
jgi:aminopeptidase N